MKAIVEAIYQGGALYPLSDLDLHEKERVRLTVESEDQETEIADPSPPWRQFAGCISHEDAQMISAVVEEGCERVNLDDWR